MSLNISFFYTEKCWLVWLYIGQEANTNQEQWSEKSGTSEPHRIRSFRNNSLIIILIIIVAVAVAPPYILYTNWTR